MVLVDQTLSKVGTYTAVLKRHFHPKNENKEERTGEEDIPQKEPQKNLQTDIEKEKAKITPLMTFWM